MGSALWFQGGIQPNSNQGAFGAHIRTYTENEQQLRNVIMGGVNPVVGGAPIPAVTTS